MVELQQHWSTNCGSTVAIIIAGDINHLENVRQRRNAQTSLAKRLFTKQSALELAQKQPVGPVWTIPPVTAFKQTNSLTVGQSLRSPLLKHSLPVRKQLVSLQLKACSVWTKLASPFRSVTTSEYELTFGTGISWLQIGKEANVPREKHIKKALAVLAPNVTTYSEDSYRSALSSKAALCLMMCGPVTSLSSFNLFW